MCSSRTTCRPTSGPPGRQARIGILSAFCETCGGRRSRIIQFHGRSRITPFVAFARTGGTGDRMRRNVLLGGPARPPAIEPPAAPALPYGRAAAPPDRAAERASYLLYT